MPSANNAEGSWTDGLADKVSSKDSNTDTNQFKFQLQTLTSRDTTNGPVLGTNLHVDDRLMPAH